VADWLTRAQRHRNMSSIRSRGNKTTEQALASLFRKASVRGWRRHAALPGRPDFVFKEKRIAVFVDGCFWHGCPRCYRLPKDNRAYWRKKVGNNRMRDRRISELLRKQGWKVVRVWEHTVRSVERTPAVVHYIRKMLANE